MQDGIGYHSSRLTRRTSTVSFWTREVGTSRRDSSDHCGRRATTGRRSDRRPAVRRTGLRSRERRARTFLYDQNSGKINLLFFLLLFSYKIFYTTETWLSRPTNRTKTVPRGSDTERGRAHSAGTGISKRSGRACSGKTGRPRIGRRRGAVFDTVLHVKRPAADSPDTESGWSRRSGDG